MSPRGAATITVPAPAFNHLGPNDTPATVLADVARRLRANVHPGGSNVSEGVARLLDSVAGALTALDADDQRTPAEREGCAAVPCSPGNGCIGLCSAGHVGFDAAAEERELRITRPRESGKSPHPIDAAVVANLALQGWIDPIKWETAVHGWRPGQVAMVLCSDGRERRAFATARLGQLRWMFADGGFRLVNESEARELAVLDPENPEDAERLARASWEASDGPWEQETERTRREYVDDIQAGLRSFVRRVKPDEPTDLKARVTDRRENIWRLLADGDWVCTSGPDIGEYLTWDRLVAERAPLEVTS